MNKNLHDIESVCKSLEILNDELDTFFQSIKEIKEIRDTVGALPERLKQYEVEIENQIEKFNQIKTFYEPIKNLETSLEEIKEPISILQKERIAVDKKIFRMEKELKVFFKKLKKQKLYMVVMFIIFMMCIIFFILSSLM